MSIEVITKIWRTCCYRDGYLVLLLAMADIGDDEGEQIYPGLDYLAAKCRSSVRAVQERIKVMRADGVVKILGLDGNDLPADATPVGGRGRKTYYRIDLERMQELHALHQRENPHCEHCIARGKRDMRRASKGAGRRSVSAAEKDEDRGAKKDADRAEKGEAGSGKDEDPQTSYRIDPSDPSLNLPPPDDGVSPEWSQGVGMALVLNGQVPSKTSPLAHTRKLAGMFEQVVLEAWFKNSHFREGPPLTLALDGRFQCNWVRERFGDQLRRAFGDDLAFTFQRQYVHGPQDA